MKVRLQKFLADCGVASRRECEEMITQGRVQINGEVRTEMPVMIDPDEDVVTIDGQALEGALQPEEPVYYLLNKPKGILVTNLDPSQRKTVHELMGGVRERVFPVGRLEMDSRGALLMTNDGELANRLTHPRFGVEKTYIVEIEGRLSPVDVERVKAGMWVGPSRPSEGKGGKKTEHLSVKIVGRGQGRSVLEIKTSEGKNREIRRVMARLGHPVRDLNRVSIGGKITIKNLPVGSYRKLSPDEVKWLLRVSSPEYHERLRAATQEWYENKEMNKERKRLDREAQAASERGKRPAPRGKFAPRSNRPIPQQSRVRPAAINSPPPAIPKPSYRPHPLGKFARREEND